MDGMEMHPFAIDPSQLPVRHGSGATGSRSADEIPVPQTPPDNAELAEAINMMRRLMETEIAELKMQLRPEARKVSFEEAEEESVVRKTRRNKRGEK